jgi:hypothetical protein
MKIVMVHGRSQQGKDPIALEKTWRDALTYGLARADAELAAETTFAFPFYADELDDLVKQVNAPLADTIVTRGNPDEDNQALRGEILAEIAASLGLSARDFDREIHGAAIERGPANWEWVQAILRAVDRIPGLNGEAIDTFTRDVYVYLTYPAVRTKIDAIVAAALPNEPFVLLAHSLGTIVTYNILRKHAVDPKCVRLVTVGCPLGIKAIQARIERPLESPACVGNWFNAYDDRDVVALRPLDATNFAVRPPIENKGDVINFTDNRHGIAGYLSDPTVAKKLADATHVTP